MSNENLSGFLEHCKTAKASAQAGARLTENGQLALNTGTPSSPIDVSSDYALQLQKVVADLARVIADVEIKLH